MAILLRPLVVGALVLGGLSAAPASAFEYYEHRRATEHVLDGLCAKPFGARYVCKAREALLTVMHESDKRLVAGDLVAIAGDHSVSPPSMVWRFFIGRRGNFYLPNLNVLHGGSPENVDQSAIDLERFLDTIEAVAPPTEPPEEGWRQCAKDRKALYDKEMMGSAASFVDAAKAADVESISSLFSEKIRTARLLPKPPVDPNYIANAAHNASHFRIPAGVSDEQLWARAYYRLRSDAQGRPSRNKPALHAISYYGDLHTGALVLMRAAKQAKRQRRKDLLAASLILELFALHYQQDGVSAGHLGGEAVHNLGYPSFFLRHDSDRFETMDLLPLPAHDDGMFAHSQAPLVEGVDRKTFCRRRGLAHAARAPTRRLDDLHGL